MTFLEQPWQARADHAGTATRHRGASTGAVAAEADETAPGWYRPAFLVMLAAVAVLYLWDLSASGYANSFYAAAVQAGTENWKAWFFGSLDSSNFITVDKPPGVALGDGAVRPDLRLQQLVAAGAAGARGRRGGGAAVRHRAPGRARTRGRPGRRGGGADRGGGDGADPGRGAHLPVRQPRRVHGAAGRGGRVLRHPGARARADLVAGGRGGRVRVRVPDQERRGGAQRARVRAGVPGRGPGAVPATGPASCSRRRRDRGLGRVVDRGGAADACGGPAVHRRVDR